MKKASTFVPLVFLFVLAAILIINPADSSLRKTKLNIISEVATTNPELSFILVSDENTIVEGPDFIQNAVATWVPSIWNAEIPGATWIWESALVKYPSIEETFVFTKEFRVPGTPTKAILKIAADDNYIISMNGRFVGSDNTAYNFVKGSEGNYDLLSKTVQGANFLQVTVTNLPAGSRDPYVNPAGLLFKLSISYLPKK